MNERLKFEMKTDFADPESLEGFKQAVTADLSDGEKYRILQHFLADKKLVLVTNFNKNTAVHTIQYAAQLDGLVAFLKSRL